MLKKILVWGHPGLLCKELMVHWQIYAMLRVSASSVREPAGVGRWYLSWSWCSCTLGCPLGNLEQSRGQIWQCSQLSHLNPALVLKFNAKHLRKKENSLGWDTCPVLQFNKDFHSESFTFLCSCSTHHYLAHALDLLSVYMSVFFFSASSYSSLALKHFPSSTLFPLPPTSTNFSSPPPLALQNHCLKRQKTLGLKPEKT